MIGHQTSRHKIYGLSLSVIAWVFVLSLTFYLWEIDYPDVHNRLNFVLPNIALTATCFTLYMIGIVWRIFAQRNNYQGLILQATALSTLLFLFPNGVIVILVILLIAQLSEYLSASVILVIAVATPVIYFLQVPAEFAWFNIILFILLNLFSLYASNRMLEERKAKEINSHLLRELRATQSLLHSTILRDERLRIARDLHDSLGHHLTALSIQLEVASQISLDKAQHHIIKAQSIAQLLLGDVREAVSDIRSSNELDLSCALIALTEDLDILNLQIVIEPDLIVTDARAAEILFHSAKEAITNVLKHSGATHCQLSLIRDRDTGELLLTIEDNGRVKFPIKPGNGLCGMKERIRTLDGRLILNTDKGGLNLQIRIPEPI
ncbi:MAG: sensor histidine kinase [Nitrincola lacisaponensis]|uniref:sensor histidine kinase n=1 Tax=Nitrincola lacisaponensis TaxID=267850 RepID=UPI00391AD7AA